MSVMIPKLSNNAKKVYTCLLRFSDEHGYKPSHKEIADKLSISKYEVYLALNELENARLVIRKANAVRAIKLLDYVLVPKGNTKKQTVPTLEEAQRVYGTIIEYVNREGYSPTYKEISSKICASTSKVRRICRYLYENNFLTYKSKTARSIVLCRYTYSLAKQRAVRVKGESI